MSKKKIIIFGLVFLNLILGGGFLAWQYLQSEPPQNVRISNITDSSLTISWTTKKPTSGSVRFSEERLNVAIPLWRHFRSQKAFDDHGRILTVHHITLKNLKSETPYYYRINSSLRFFKFDRQGKLLPPIATGPVLGELSMPNPAYGKVYLSDGVTPLEGVIVYLTPENTTSQQRGTLLSTLTNNEGGWTIDLGNTRTEDLNKPLNLADEGDKEHLLVEGGVLGQASKTINTDEDKPAPIIVLGR